MTIAHRIRLLTPDDTHAYRELRLEALRSHPDAFGASLADEEARPPEMIAKRLGAGPTNCLFGAFAESKLVGTAGFIIPNGSAKSRHKGLLVGVYVKPRHRGQAVGRALVQAVIDHARGQVVLLQAAVGAANIPALRIYEQLGFRQYGLEKKALLVGDAYVDEALLVLDFTEAD